MLPLKDRVSGQWLSHADARQVLRLADQRFFFLVSDPGHGPISLGGFSASRRPAAHRRAEPDHLQP